MAHTRLPGIEQFNMKGRTAMITGGSKGLGLAMAAGLASAGCSTALVNRNLEEGISAAEELNKDFGVKAKAYSADVTNLKQVEAVVKEIENDFGKIDILINSAGINIRGAIDELSPEDFNQVMKV
ncbi:MAG: SDR family NAD(P)-dependent oxidoreductase, partial [Eudoraea sp.]